MDRNAEGRQALSYHYAQARVIDRQPALKRIYRKNGRFGRKAKDGLHIRSGLEIGRQLAKE